MEKSKLILLGIVILVIGLGVGYFVSRYTFQAQLQKSNAMKMNNPDKVEHSGGIFEGGVKKY
jgi:uncharacterized protein YneF (UPF0154 family)